MIKFLIAVLFSVSAHSFELVQFEDGKYGARDTQNGEYVFIYHFMYWVRLSLRPVKYDTLEEAEKAIYEWKISQAVDEDMGKPILEDLPPEAGVKNINNYLQ